MRVASLILSLLLVVQAATRADDLDIIVAPHSTPQARGEAYQRLEYVDFLTIGWKLANCIDTYTGSPLRSIMGRVPDKPWLDERLRTRDRIAFTLSKLWHVHLSRGKTVERSHGLMIELLDNDSLSHGKILVLSEVQSRLNSARRDDGTYSDSHLPPVETILAKMDRIVRDEKQFLDCRKYALKILLENRDPGHALKWWVESGRQLE